MTPMRAMSHIVFIARSSSVLYAGIYRDRIDSGIRGGTDNIFISKVLLGYQPNYLTSAFWHGGRTNQYANRTSSAEVGRQIRK